MIPEIRGTLKGHSIKMKTRYLKFPFLILLLSGIFLLPYLQLSYSIQTRGIISPAREWVLSRAGDGQMSYALNDYFHGSISHYAITEFQRGDHGEFRLKEGLFSRGYVYSGDTIGVILSNEEQRRYIQLLGELESRESLLNVYLTGQRPQDVTIAHERVLLAGKELQAQERILERSRKLYAEQVIPAQEYELVENQYEVRQMALQIARSEHQSLLAGAKPEQLELVRAEIRAIQAQINQLSNRLEAFTVRSPITGNIIFEPRQDIPGQTFIRIAEDSPYIVVFPVEVHQLAYVQPGQKVLLIPENRSQIAEATIVSLGNSVQLINRRQNVFVTATLDQNHAHILPGMLIQAKILTGRIGLVEYTSRITKAIYAN